MHLVRLFMMGTDILENGLIRTRRPDDELKLLRSIRDGKYMVDGRLNDDFYNIVAEFEEKYRKAELRSKLPDNPDMARIEAFVEKINRRVVLGEFL